MVSKIIKIEHYVHHTLLFAWVQCLYNQKTNIGYLSRKNVYIITNMNVQTRVKMTLNFIINPRAQYFAHLSKNAPILTLYPCDICLKILYANTDIIY